MPKIAYISDIHAPYEDVRALKLAMKVLRETSPDRIIIGGDLVDFYAVSSFSVDITRADIGHELRGAQKILKNIREQHPKAQIDFIVGNHDIRIMKYLYTHADRLIPLLVKELSLPGLFDFKKYGIRYHQRPFEVGHLWFLHGHEKSSGLGQPIHVARNLLSYMKRNIIFGHFHRFQTFVDTEMSGKPIGAWAIGCLFDLQRMPTPYQVFSNEQKGMAIVYMHKNGIFKIDPLIFVPDIDNHGFSCMVEGKRLSV